MSASTAADTDRVIPLRDQLASDARAGTFARRKARTTHRTYLRRNWLELLAVYLGASALFASPALMYDDAFIRGLVVGLALAGTAGVVATATVIQTGTGPTMAGEMAEQWTAQELRPLGKHGYRLANHVSVDNRGDADHVLIGPAGCFVLETKWSASEWVPGSYFLADAVQQAEGRARGLRLQVPTLRSLGVTPIVVLWGAANNDLARRTGVTRSGHTYVIAGPDLRRWLLSRARGVLDEAEVQAVHNKVRQLAVEGDRREAKVPPSVGRLGAAAVATIAIGMSSFIIPAYATRAGRLAFAASALAAIVAGWQARRRLPSPVFGAAAITGALGSVAVVALSYLL